MTYELAKKENAWMKCPHCGGRCVKFGIAHHNNKPRAKCRECQKTFYTDVIKSDKILQLER